MRKTAAMVFLAVCLALVGARIGMAGTTLANILPPHTIACVVPPDERALEHTYANSLLRRLEELPDMAPFFQSMAHSKSEMARDLSINAGVSQELAGDIVTARLGGALIDIGVDRAGKARPEYVVTLTLNSAPDRQLVFNAVRTLLNRREVVQAALESQGMDPNMPIRTLAQEETIPGYPPMLRIGPFIRVAVIDRMIVLYNGPGADGIKALFDAQQNPSLSLAGSQPYQAAWRGAESGPGSTFTYLNVSRLMTILDAAGLSSVTRIIDALGLATAQSVGVAGGYEREGMLHNLYVHTPGGLAGGLLSSLLPMPDGAPHGMEIYSQVTPSQAQAFMAIRLDFQSFLSEAPYFAEAVGAVSRPGGMSGYLDNETILGIPLGTIVSALGNDLIVRPHDDTQVALFADIDAVRFERLLATMEQNAGARFRVLDIGGYKIRYFNQRADATLPLAPAMCMIPRQQQPGRGFLYVATHPQALVSLIRELVSARTPISQSQDYLQAVHGLDKAYSLFYYADCRDSYRRFYNAMLPLASLWASSAAYPVDTGLLPVSESIMPGLFGLALGAKADANGLSIQTYSPVGINALFILLADRLVLSNPLVLGYVHSWALELRESLPW